MNTFDVVKHCIFVVSFGLILAGCQSTITSDVNSQVFQGYPCQENCPNFIKGYELAQAQNYTKDTQCDKLSPDLRLGCLSYMREYRLEQEQPAGGYVFINNKTM